MNNVICTKNLDKEFQGVKTISNVNIHVKKHEIYGFLGPNGAGKTTIMKMLINLLKPSKGEIELFGERLTPTSYGVLKRMSSIIEYPVFYDHLSGKENLKLHCDYMGYYSPNCIEETLELLDLTMASDKLVREYSLGMKQRLGIARAILTKPELLILDEPTNGLDPTGIKQIRELLLKLNREYGTTIVISSHMLSEIESIADTIGLVNKGELVKELSIDEIHRMNLSYLELETSNLNQASVILLERLGIDNFKVVDNKFIRIYEDELEVQELSKELVNNDIPILSLSKKSETLEDFFLKMTEGEK